MLALPKKHVTSAGLAAMSMIIRGGIIEERELVTMKLVVGLYLCC